MFLPGIAPYGATADLVRFDAVAELSRVFLYDLPALALILYLFFADRSPGRFFFARPAAADIRWALVAFAGLILTAGILSVLSSLIGRDTALPLVEAPRGVFSWLVMPLTGISTGYLEESYFRAYLLTRFSEAGIGPKRSILASTVLFSLCHLYEGPWGILNAAAAGVLLSLVFLKSRSVHGPAWAHGAYNALVYAAGV